MSAPVEEGRRRNAFGGRGPRQGDAWTDPMGTVRRSPDGRWLAILLPSPPHPARWHVQDHHGSGGYERCERVAHWPIVGAVPWSPAAGVPLDGSVPTPPTMTRVTEPQLVRPEPEPASPPPVLVDALIEAQREAGSGMAEAERAAAAEERL